MAQACAQGLANHPIDRPSQPCEADRVPLLPALLVILPLASELRGVAQDEAERLYLLKENHSSILHSARSEQLLERALNSLPAQGCKPSAE